jgi:hypothetical protein
MRFSLRTTAVVCLLLCIVLTYAGSYYRLSRRGMREAGLHGADDVFAYVPIAEMGSGDNATHNFRAFFYFPANAIDRRFFGGWSPVIYESLSG